MAQSMIRKNVASQPLRFDCLQVYTTGVIISSGASIAWMKDTAYAAGAGTLAYIANGIWAYTPTQSETDCTRYAAILTATGAESRVLEGMTLVADPTLAAWGAVMPTTAGRTLDISTGGEAGLDWANVGSPTTTVGLSGTTISTGQGIASVSGAVGSVTAAVLLPTMPTDWLTAAGLKADAVTEIQSGLATPTNITAGTLTTVTNLTNAPTTGDLTATMKTSVTTAATAATPTIASVSGSVGSVTAAVTLPTIPADWITAAGIATDAIGSAEISAAAVTKIQAGLATPTNITAGTITTTTNLTNAPTAGDLTATMKTSVTTAATAATPTIASVSGAVGSVTAAVLLPTMPTDWLTAAGLKADAVTEIQSGLATPTNITAATGIVLSGVTHTGAVIPTVTTTGTATNLTNAPTAGDLTATMKASVTTAVPTAAAIQSGLATPTNITAGTLTTVTNLTNAPTSGDLTATMKTSVTTAATAATPNLNAAYNPAKTASQAGDAMALTSGERTTLTGSIWNALTSGMTTVGSVGKKLADWVIGSPMQAGSTVVLTDASLTTAKLGAFTLAKTTNITGFNDLSAAQVNTEADTALADVGLTTTVTGRVDAAITTRASQASLDTLDDYVDTEVAAIKATTDQFVFTVANQVDSNALSGGGSGLTAAQTRAALGLASANLDTQLSDISQATQSVGTAVADVAASTDSGFLDTANSLAIISAGITGLTITAGEIALGTEDWQDGGRLDLILDSRASQTSLDTQIADVPTVAEFNARTLATADYFDPATDAVIVGTNNDKTGYSLTQTFPSNFAALGINVSGHVSRVVLVDTTTTNTDMRGTDGANTTTPPTVAAIRAEMDANSTKLTDIAADTDELQSNQDNWLTATGFSTHSAADVWAVGTRTLTGFGSLVADVVSAVWASASRTLTAFGFTPSLHADYNAAKTAATQTSVDDLPTNGELSTALSAADDATLSAITALNNLSSSQVSGLLTTLASTLATEHGAGSWATATGFATQGSVDDLPTNGELATALAGSDDAMLAAVAALNNLSPAQVATLLTTLKSDLATDHGAGSWETADVSALATAAALAAVKADTLIAKHAAVVGLGTISNGSTADESYTHGGITVTFAGLDANGNRSGVTITP